MLMENNENGGCVEFPFVKLYPDFIKPSIFADADLLKLWILCLMLAGREAKHHYVRHHFLLHKSAIVDTKVGQFIANMDELHEVFFANITKPHLRPKDLWRKLQELQISGLVELEDLEVCVAPEITVYSTIATVKHFGLGG